MRTHEASWLGLSRQPHETLRTSVERSLREAIHGGSLAAGTRLPSSRALAGHLAVSRGVVTDAYARLAAQGLLETRRKAAPVVALAASAASAAPAAAAPAPRPRYDFTATTPDVTLFPAGRWVAAMRQAVASAPPAGFDYGDPQGDVGLRQMLAAYLGRARGVSAGPQDILVVQGAAQAIDLVARLLVRRGARRVVVNDPGLPSQAERFAESGLDVVHQPVDGAGLIVEDWHADAVLTTPAHQFPTGAVLTARRRQALIGWAQRGGRLVIEDDYDGEFRYDREGVRALQGLAPDRVAYVGTASKTLAPAVRLGWLVLPRGWMPAAVAIKHLLDGGSPSFDQRALASLLQSGEYERQVRRARAQYRRRRDALVAALAQHCPGLPVDGIAAGLHVILRLPQGWDDGAIAARAAAAGIRVAPLADFAHAAPVSGLVLGFGPLPEASVEAGVQALAQCMP